MNLIRNEDIFNVMSYDIQESGDLSQEIFCVVNFR